MSWIPTLDTIRSLILLAIGFGFVVFWHELGHFLAAKWAGVKVEQFAVGFGQAVLSWRKGIGFRFGSTQKEYQKRLQDHLDATGQAGASRSAPDESGDGSRDDSKDKSEGPTLTDRQVADASAALGLGETEYRLNWIPLGGYVKMLGQDDLKPNAEADDPRAFNRQPIGKRMVIVSAGVVMNVILAAIGFMGLFLYGFHVPPAVVGTVYPGSPAQRAGLLPGDRILSIDGKDQHDDWTKVQLNAALCAADENTTLQVERVVDGKPRVITIQIKPEHGGLSKEFLGFGIAPPTDLKAPTLKEMKDAGEKVEDEATQQKMYSKDLLALKPGDVITAVEGKPVEVPNASDKDSDRINRQFLVLDDALQKSEGRPVTVTVAADEGRGPKRDIQVQPHFQEPFGTDPLNFAGMVSRVRVEQVPSDSQSFGKLLPGDVITGIGSNAGGNAFAGNPSLKVFKQRLNEAAKAGVTVNVNVLRDGKPLTISDLPTARINREDSGLKIGPGYDESHAVVADVLADSAAQKAKVPAGATLLKVANQPVSTWYDVEAALRHWAADHSGAAPMAPAPVTFRTEGGEEKSAELALSPAEVAAVDSYYYHPELFLSQARTVRKTANPLTAAWWGVSETRDFILQFYLTLRRMATGGVSPRNLMGPLGIFQAGTSFASKGNDWLIWFLAMISANLAVVNFLPIPIVDGGLFTFLILEKAKGRPLSPTTQAIAQYVGLALLLGVFLFVTWQDLANFRFRMK